MRDTATVQVENLDLTEVLTADEVARRLKTSAKTIYKLATAKEIPSFHVGRVLRFRWGDVLNALRRRD